jgi:hypothetical protein
VLHFNVTTHPYGAWAAQQIVEAIGAEIMPVRLIRDRDAILGTEFDARVDNLGVRQLRTAPRSPWQNGYAERWVGTLRREVLDHLIVLGERHLLRQVREYVAYYNEDRPHMALDRDAPVARAVQPRSGGTSSHFRASAGSIVVIRGQRDLPDQFFATTDQVGPGDLFDNEADARAAKNARLGK